MEDKLKKFIQRSKTEFNREEPRPDLFDKIMENMDTEQTPLVAGKKLISTRMNWLAVAASLALLISCCWFLFYTNKPIYIQNTQVASGSTRTKNNQAIITNEISSTSTAGKEQDIQIEKGTNNKSDQTPVAQLKSKNNRTAIPSNERLPAILQSNSLTAHEPIQSIITDEPKVNEQIAETSNADQKISLQSNVTSNDPAPSMTQNPTMANQVSKMPEGAKIIASLPVANSSKSEPLQKSKKSADLAEEDTEQDNSLQSTIKKGIFGFLSKNAKKLTGNTLSIKNSDNGDYTVLALHYKNDKIEISKDINLGSFGE